MNKKFFLLLLIGLAGLLLVACKQPNTATVTYRTGSAIKNAKTKQKALDDLTIVEDKELFILEEIDMEGETLSVCSVSSDKQYRYKYNMTTRFEDKFGQATSPVNFFAGTVVELGEKLPSSGALSSVKKTDSVWIYENVDNYQIDVDNKLFQMAGSNYKLTDLTRCYSDYDRILPGQIGENDILTVVGNDKDIYSIAITTGHGYIQLTNTELFDGSLIFIGNKIVSLVDGDELLEVPEGVYDVTVANEGWGGSDEYEVYRNDTTIINLDDLKGDGPSYCDVTFEVVVPDTYVYLDGKLIDTDEIQSVRYGKHKLVVQCNGFVSWDKTLVVNSESATITLVMQQERVKSNTTSDTRNDEDSGNTENSKNSVDNQNNSNENAEDGTEPYNSENLNPTNNTKTNVVDTTVPIPKSPADNNTTTTNTEYGTNPAPPNTNSNSTTNNSNSNTNNTNNQSNDYDYESDYLSTISQMLNNITN